MGKGPLVPQPEEDDTILLSVPTAVPKSIPGSIARMAQCGHEVWVSPTSQRMLVEHESKGSGSVEIRCLDCGVKPEHKENPEFISIPGDEEEVCRVANISPQRFRQLQSMLKEHLRARP